LIQRPPVFVFLIVLGHESVTTTQKYLHPELKDIAETVNERNSDNAAANLRHSEGVIQ